MSRTITARLDAETAKLLADLARNLGWKESRVVREGIKALTTLVAPKRSRKIVGLGRFRSGVPDLGSSKAHMEGFGR